MCRDVGRLLVDAAVDAVKRQQHYGPLGHEIVVVFDARLADASLYARATLVGEESDGQTFVAQWLPLATFAPGGPPLHPDGLYALLARGD